MTGKFIAVANMKGGVGKTTTVVSLAETFAADDLKSSILVVDVDPQASASICLAGDEVLTGLIEQGRTLQDFLELRLITQDKKPHIREYIRSHFEFTTTHQGEQLPLSLLPCGTKLRLLEREIIYQYTKHGFSMNAIEGRLSKIFESDFAPLRSQFDYVIFDCPPGISPFAEVTIRSADIVIVPTIPDRISNFGLNAFCSGFWHTGVHNLATPALPYVLISRLQENVKQHRDMVERLKKEARSADAAFRLLKTQVRQSAALAKALSFEGSETFTRKYTLEMAQILKPLAAEIKELLHGNRH